MAKGRGINRVIGDVGLGAFGLFLGAAVFLLYQSTIGGAASDTADEPVLVFEAPAAGPGAESPEEAVRAFLDAEVDDEADSAFDLLSEGDRLTNGSAEMWASRNPMGDLQSWEWADKGALVTNVALEPGLSRTRGWSPASTTLTWSVVDEDGWRISLAGSVAEPSLANSAAAVGAATAWLNDPARCAKAADPRLVLATPSSAFDQLCSTGGVLAEDSSTPVAGRVAADLQLAYGPGAAVWARSVRLEGGVELTLVAIGDRWLVVDAVSS